MKRLLLTLLTSSLFFVGCGYRAGYGGIPAHYRTISIPFVQGDVSGSFTAELTRQISATGAFKVLSCSADLTLCVKILEVRDQNIGFRYDRDEQGCIEETLVPAETRRFALAEVTLYDRCTGCVIAGPDIIRAYTEFDHEFNSSRDGVNVFSLGQVTDIDQAVDAAQRPLNQHLARRIVDYLVNAW